MNRNDRVVCSDLVFLINEALPHVQAIARVAGSLEGDPDTVITAALVEHRASMAASSLNICKAMLHDQLRYVPSKPNQAAPEGQSPG